jgi:hypothetical protein
MLTNLNQEIRTIQDAKNFLTELIRNGEFVDPCDDIYDINWTYAEPTNDEKDKLKKLLTKCMSWKTFDPYQHFFEVEVKDIILLFVVEVMLKLKS